MRWLLVALVAVGCARAHSDHVVGCAEHACDVAPPPTGEVERGATAAIHAGERTADEVPVGEGAALGSEPVNDLDRVSEHRHVTCGMGGVAIVVFGAALFVLVAIVVLVVLVVRALRRAAAIRLAFAEPVSLLVAEQLARSSRCVAGVITVLALSSIPAIATAQLPELALGSTLVAVYALRNWVAARAILGLIGRSHTIAEVVGPRIVVRNGARVVALDVSTSALAEALKHAVPTSIAAPRA